jgi:hypothetical protein
MQLEERCPSTWHCPLGGPAIDEDGESYMPNKFSAGDYAVIISDLFSDNIGKMVRIADPEYRDEGKFHKVLVEACDKVSGLSFLAAFESEYGDLEEYKGTCIEMPVFADNLIRIFSTSASSHHEA